MSEFEISRGYAEIEDGIFRVNTSPLEGLNRLYRHHKLVLFSSVVIWMMIAWLLFFIDLFSTNVMRNLFGVFSLVIIFSLAVEKFFISTGRKKYTEIPLSSIEKIEFDEFTATKLSRINIIYSEEGTEKSHNIWLRVFGVGSADRLENAISVIESTEIELEQGERSKNL